MARARINIDRHAESLRDGIGRDVVMGRADPACGEDVIIACAQRVYRRDDLILDIGYNTHLPQTYADGGEMIGDRADIGVLGPPGEEFVTDHQDGGGDDGGRRRAIRSIIICHG